MKRSKRYKEVEEIAKEKEVYSLEDAIALLQKCPKPKFDESVEVSIKTGVDPKKSDQQVRGTVSLPHGTGKTIKVLVIAKGDKAKQAEAAGADMVGSDDMIDKIKGGWTGFDALVTTPDMMRDVGRLGKVLGPRGLMPTPKAGTVTTDVEKAVTQLKAGMIEFKADKSALINNIVGKLSFSVGNLVENFKTLFGAIERAKPSSAKGNYILSVYLSSTMGPGLKIDLNSIS